MYKAEVLQWWNGFHPGWVKLLPIPGHLRAGENIQPKTFKNEAPFDLQQPFCTPNWLPMGKCLHPSLFSQGDVKIAHSYQWHGREQVNHMERDVEGLIIPIQTDFYTIPFSLQDFREACPLTLSRQSLLYSHGTLM